MERITLQNIQDKKNQKQKITMLTAYDFPTGKLVDEAGVDITLVGDSLANVALGLESTRDVGMDEMVHHAKAVRRAVKRSLLVCDLPYDACQTDQLHVVDHANRLIHEAGCDAVKIEWFDQCDEVFENVIQSGIPVMGHVGLTPQTAEEFKVQGKDLESAKEILRQAKVLEAKGCFAIVLECVPTLLAKIISDQLKVPTIGIGAGAHCDGQVLVFPDVVGLLEGFRPKFVKQYVNSREVILEALQKYCHEVTDEKFPDQERSYSMDENELKRLLEDIG